MIAWSSGKESILLGPLLQLVENIVRFQQVIFGLQGFTITW